MEHSSEHVRVNLNKELWKIDYSTGIARRIREKVTVDDKTFENPSGRKNNHDNNLEGLSGYNGDMTQYLEEKGYTWEQLDEDSIKFIRQ
jgi:hypothetical protein